MTFRRVLYSYDSAVGRMPAWVAQIIAREKTICYAALDDDNCVLGVAIYTLSPVSKRDVVLRYIYVEDEVRRVGIATMILKHSFDELKKMNAYSISCRVFGDIPLQDKAYYLLTDADYVPLSLDGHFLNYTLKEIKHSILAQKKDQLENSLRNVKFLNEISELQKKAFYVKANENDLLFDLDTVDLLFSSFYVINDEIVGYFNLKEVTENVILLSDIYIDRSVNAPLVITSMLAAMIKISCSVMPDETQFYFQVYEDNEFNGFQTAFGKKKYNIEISEYVKIL